MPIPVAASSSIRNTLRRARRMVNQALGRDVRSPIQVQCAREMLGSEYGGWCVCPDGLDRSSVVYSFGVGQDISWDLAMIDRFGVTVHAFDPTPKSIEWIRSQKLPSEFMLHEYGLADYDGTAHFVLPRADFVSFSMAGAGAAGSNGAGTIEIDAPVHTLQTIMRMLGHDHVDVLKMDIEGAELGVIDALTASSPRPRIAQLLVEFHHRVGVPAEVAATARAIERINAMGLKLFHNSAVGKEFSFLLRS